MHARCPHCSKVFETPSGGRQFCPSCGEQVHVPEAPVAEATTVPVQRAEVVPPPPSPGPQRPFETSTGVGPTPWERRSELGFVNAFVSQWKETVFRSATFWPTVEPRGAWQDALLFGWVCFALAVVVSAPISFLMGGGPSMVGSVFGGVDTGTGVGMGLGAMIGVIALYPVVALFQTAVVHLGCLLLGCASNGFLATFRTITYGSAPQALAGIPCVGFLFGLFAFVIEVQGIKNLQRTTTGRAVAAALVIPLVIFCCVGSALVGLVMFGMGALGGRG